MTDATTTQTAAATPVRVAAPDSSEEREADRIADAVIRGGIVAPPAGPPRPPAIHRKCATCASGGPPCAGCARSRADADDETRRWQSALCSRSRGRRRRRIGRRPAPARPGASLFRAAFRRRPVTCTRSHRSTTRPRPPRASARAPMRWGTTSPLRRGSSRPAPKTAAG